MSRDSTSALIADAFRESVAASIDNRPWRSTSCPASTTRPFPSLVCTRGPFLSGRTGKGPSSSSLSPSCETTQVRGRDMEALKQSEPHRVTGGCASCRYLFPKGMSVIMMSMELVLMGRLHRSQRTVSIGNPDALKQMLNPCKCSTTAAMDGR